MNPHQPILPGATIGILGGGQLGRMSAIAGQQLGYHFHVFDPQADGPASAVCNKQSTAPFEDQKALAQFAQSTDLVTLEFENIPVSTLQELAQEVPLYPQASILHICQNRQREKHFLQEHNIPHAPFRIVENEKQLAEAVEALGTPCVLKTADFGYDGKGQFKIESEQEIPAIWSQFAQSPAATGVVEAWIAYQKECSVLCARNVSGEISTFPVIENEHRHHILDISICPARLESTSEKQVLQLAHTIAAKLELVGLLAIEYFVTENGDVLVNEMAPRPHNSGHLTIEACPCSQFEQHIRAITGMPLGKTEPVQTAVMLNILGNSWQKSEPPWPAILQLPHAHLHLYGKKDARPGRKMGHITFVGADIDTLLAEAEKARQLLA